LKGGYWKREQPQNGEKTAHESCRNPLERREMTRGVTGVNGGKLGVGITTEKKEGRVKDF